MGIKTYNKDGVDVVEVNARLLGGPETEQLDKELYAIIGKGKKKAVIDLAGCDRMVSPGIGVLLRHLKEFRANNGEVRLANLSDRIENLLTHSRLQQEFNIHDSVDDAVKALS
jgi:anti-sigma B factor antagonist